MIPFNRAILASRWPAVLEAIERADISPWCLSESPAPTVMVDGIQLTSGYDRVKEALLQCEHIPEDAPETWVYGVALGDLPTVLLRRPQLQHLHVIILSTRTAALSLGIAEHPWLADQRVELHLGGDRLRTPLVIAPAELRFAERYAHRIRDGLSIILNREFNERQLAAREQIIDRHAAENAKRGDPSVRDLFGTRSGSAVVVMGGPTAPQYFDWINGSDMLVIAASTMWKPLQRAGIIPDIVINIEPIPLALEYFKGANYSAEIGPALVYIHSAPPSTLAIWPWRRYSTTLSIKDGGDLYSGGSVLHSACDLAVKMGAREVYLVGADLCHPNSRSHAQGVDMSIAVNEPWRPTVVNGLGEEVKSGGALIQFAYELEWYVSQHHGVKWWKLGREGMPINGVDWYDAVESVLTTVTFGAA